MVKHNISQLSAMKDIVKENGADGLRLKKINFRMASLSVTEARAFMPEEEALNMFTIRYDRLIRKQKQNVICTNVWDSMVITWDGKVLTCCEDFDATSPLGNVFAGGIAKVWNGAPSRMIRRQMKEDIFKIDLCSECIGFVGLSMSNNSV